MLSSLTNSAIGGSLRAPADFDRDVLQTIQARMLLRDDPDLSAWNIGVTVQDRVLVLWGPVPNAEVLFRAELCVRTMPGLVGVRNELFVYEPAEAIRPPLRIQLPPAPIQRQPPPKLPPEPSRASAGAPGVLAKQVTPMAANKKSATPPSATPASVKTSQPSATPTLGAPLRDDPPTLADSVRAALQSRPAFRDLQFAISDGRVFLKGNDASALIEAAQVMARIPGVMGVVVTGNED